MSRTPESSEREGESAAEDGILSWQLAFLVVSLLVGLAVTSSYQACSSGRLDSVEPTSVSEPPGPEHVKSNASPDTRLRLADRYYVTSVLTGVFGDSEEVKALVHQEVLSQIDVFGGPCDPYEAPTGDSCPTIATGSQVATIAAPSVLREARRVRACDLLLDRPAALATALDRIHGDVEPEAPDAESIRAAYALFNPGRSIAAGALAALLQISKSGADVNASWHRVLTVLCHDPSWEVP